MFEVFAIRKGVAVAVLGLLIAWCLSMPVPFLGQAAFLVYLYLVGKAATRVLVILFNFSYSRRTFVLGLFIIFVTLGSWLCVALLVGKLTPLMYALVFLINGCAWFWLDYYAVRRSPPRLEEADAFVTQEPKSFWIFAGVFVYAVLFIVGLILLYQTRSEGSLTSPWQTIHPHYLYIFIAATIVLGWLSLTSLSTRSVVVLFIAHTFLLHSYLPLSHSLFYGADGWRHLANVQTIIAEEPLVEAALSEAPGTGAYFGILPYGQMWGLMALLTRLFGVSPVVIIKWFVPVIWSLIFPLLIVELAKLFSLGKRGTFYLLWTTLFPFALQAAGSFTLPVSFGLPIWLFLTILVLKRIDKPRQSQMTALAVLGFLSIFGYSLYAVLFWLGWFVAELIYWPRERGWQAVVIVFSGIVGMLSIPALELIAGYSTFKPIAWFGVLKEIVGNFSGWYVAMGPRTFDTIIGNILINQVPSAAYVPNVFTAHLWWLPIVAIVFFGLAIWGTWYALSRRQMTIVWFGVMSFALTGGYLISRYLLAGEQLFSRRLDPVLAIIYCVVIVFVLRYLDRSITSQPIVAKLLPVFLIFDALVIGALYTLGPDTGVVSTADAQAMEYVWQHDKNQPRHCVIADTYPLLALEAISHKQIIGGGFPINEYFAQPELQAIWRKANGTLSASDLQAAFLATGANNCWIVKNGTILNKTDKN